MPAVEGSLSVEQLAKLKISTVLVLTSQGSGSGFVCQRVGDDGALIATNAHVVGNANGVQVVLSSGTQLERILEGSIVALSRNPDLALIWIRGKDLPAPLDIAVQDKLSETQGIWVFGFPFGDWLRTGVGHPAITISKGSITSLRRNDHNELSVVQIDADINPGNSGGPVVDGECRVVGVATAKIDGTGVGLAIPAAAVNVLMTGRIESFAWEAQEADEHRATYRLTANVSDPLRKIASISLHVIARSQVHGKIPENTQAVADMRETACVIAAGQARATVAFTSAASGTEEELFQIRVTRRDGTVTWTEAQQFVAEFPAKVQPGHALLAGAHDNSQPVVQMAPAAVPTLIASGKMLFGESFNVGDAVVKLVDLPAKGIVKPLLSIDGKWLFILNPNGQLRQVALPSGSEKQVLDLNEQATCFAQSKDGLLIYLPRTKELLVVSPQDLKVLRRIPLSTCADLAAAPGTSLAYAASGTSLKVVDTAKGQCLKSISADALETIYGARIKRHQQSEGLHMFGSPILTPNGQYLFCQSGSCLHRFRSDGTDLLYEEVGPSVGGGSEKYLEISDDGAYVALPSSYTNGDIVDHPKISGCVYFVYSTTDLQRPATTILAGSRNSGALAFATASARIFTMNDQQQLMVFTAQGMKGKEYRFSKEGHTSYIVPSIDGVQALVMTEEDMFWVALPGADGVVAGNGQVAKVSGWIPPLVAVTAQPSRTLPGLPAKVVRNAQGMSYMELHSIGQAIDLGSDVTGIAAAPSGEVLYVMHAEDPVVSVVDPSTWKARVEIPVPKAPTSLWCDGALIAVACPESQVVVFIDPVKQELLRSIRYPEHPTWRPVKICGRSPTGGITTLWQADPFDSYLPRLVDIGLDGVAKLVSECKEVNPRSGVWLPGGRVFFAEDGTRNDAGSATLIHLFKVGPQLELKDDLFSARSSFRNSCGPAFVTHDQAAMVLPLSWFVEVETSPFSTAVLSPQLDQVLMRLPGTAVCEVPDRGLLITLDQEITLVPIAVGSSQKLRHITPQVRYIARATGQTLRVVYLDSEPVVDNQNSRFAWIDSMKPDRGAVYIPGQELMLVPSDNAAKVLEYIAYRCGPPAGESISISSRDPPITGQTGTALTYQPDGGKAGSKYRIKRPLPGMTINTDTGAWSWTPTAAQVGSWHVAILATVDGKEAALITWTVSVHP